MIQERYFAFISYSHKDAACASWIQEAIERYRLPAIISKEVRKPLPKKIYPVFLGHTDLGVGKLVDNLHQELDESRFLIVVCSPNSKVSRRVNQEIEYFISRRGEGFVIPLVVSGAIEESIPDLLRNVPCIDARNMDGKRVVCQVVAKIMCVKPDEARFERRLCMTNRKRWMGMLLAPVALPIIGCKVGWEALCSIATSAKTKLGHKVEWPRRHDVAFQVTDDCENDSVGVGVVAPSEVERNDDVMIQVVGDVGARVENVIEAAQSLDVANGASLRGRLSLENIPHKTTLRFILQIPDFKVDDDSLTQIWNGRPFMVQFFATAGKDCRFGAHRGKILISVEGRPIGRIGFVINVVTSKSSKDRREAATIPAVYRHYFVSYSDKDFNQVMNRLQGIQLVDPNLMRHSFVDKLFLRPGDRYESVIFNYIDNKADVFLLFWSKNAAVSEWVKKEYRRALLRQTTKDGLPDIVPVPLETPIPTPPEELAHLHFADLMSQLIAGREKASE